MAKLKIKKLEYPIWLKILYYLLTVVAPISLLIVQGLYSPHKAFRISFSVICTALLTWIFISKFIIKPYVDKIINSKASLEHDYQIEVGNMHKCKYLWLDNEIKLVILQIVKIGLFGSLIVLLVSGIKNNTFNVKGSSCLVIIFYLIAFIIQVIYLVNAKNKVSKLEERNSKNSANKESATVSSNITIINGDVNNE